MLNKIFMILLIPIILLAIVADILIGDLVTDTKTTIKQKITEHKKIYMASWSK